MGLLHVVFILIVIGILLYLINRFIPMDANIKQIMNVVIVIAVVLWILSLFLPGLWSHDIPLNSTGR
jgi:riboflavin transporter FmnP